MKTSSNNPWKAFSSYSDKGDFEPDPDFYGRDTEAREIMGLLQFNDIVIIYGQSSVGKTSLLNAAIFPLVRQLGLIPKRRRFTSAKDLQKFINDLEGEDENQAPTVFVLDQFEEVFKISDTLALTLLKTITRVTAADGKHKFLIAIRQDDLYLLEEAASKLQLTEFKNNRYYLPTFDEKNAQDVILKLGNHAFAKDDATREILAGRIINYVKGLCDGQINPLVLSLTCHELWEKAGKDKQITEALVDKYTQSNNIIEDYYNSAISGLSRNEVVWLEGALLDKNGRRVSFQKSKIPKNIKWKEVSTENNEKNPVLSENQNNKSVEFIHDQLAKAAFNVKKSRGDNKSLVFWLWNFICAVFFIWSMYNAWGCFLELLLNPNNHISTPLSSHAHWLSRLIIGCLCSLYLIIIPQLWILGLKKCKPRTLMIIGIIGICGTTGFNVKCTCFDMTIYSLYYQLIQGATGIMGFLLLIYGGVKSDIVKKTGVAIKTIKLGHLFKNLWLYQTSFRVLLLVCSGAVFVFIKQGLSYGNAFSFLVLGCLLYLCIFPKITKKQIGVFLVYAGLTVCVALSDIPENPFYIQSYLNSLPVLLIVFATFIIIAYSIYRWKKTVYPFTKYILILASWLVLGCTYIFSLGFWPFYDDFFNVYLPTFRTSLTQTIMVKEDNGLYKIRAAWAKEQLVPAIIKGVVKYKWLLSNTPSYYIECDSIEQEQVDSYLKHPLTLISGSCCYVLSKKRLYFSETLITPFAYEKWPKMKYDTIDKGYFEYLSAWLNSFLSNPKQSIPYNLNDVYSTSLSYIQKVNQSDIAPNGSAKLESNEVNDKFLYDLNQCQTLCVATMLDNYKKQEMNQLSGFLLLLAYQCLFLDEMPPRLHQNLNLSVQMGSFDNYVNMNLNELISMLSSSNYAERIDAIQPIWSACNVVALNMIVNNINNESQKFKNTMDDAAHIMLNLTQDMLPLFKNYMNVDVNKIDSISNNINLQVSNFERLTTLSQQKSSYKALNNFFFTSLQPRYPLNSKENTDSVVDGLYVGGLYRKAFNANSDRYVLTLMLYDQIALSELTNPKSNYFHYYFNDVAKPTSSTASLIGKLAYNEESKLLTFIIQTSSSRDHIKQMIDKYNNFQKDMLAVLPEIKKMGIISDKLKESIKNKDLSNLVELLKQFQNQSKVINDKLSTTISQLVTTIETGKGVVMICSHKKV